MEQTLQAGLIIIINKIPITILCLVLNWRKSFARRSVTVLHRSLHTQAGGDDFALKEIRSIPESIKGASNFDAIDPNDFTVEELKELEFYLWNNSNLYLMPLWMLPFIKEEVDLGCINGKRRIFRRDEIDNDERRGFLAYGVYKD